MKTVSEAGGGGGGGGGVLHSHTARDTSK